MKAHDECGGRAVSAGNAGCGFATPAYVFDEAAFLTRAGECRDAIGAGVKLIHHPSSAYNGIFKKSPDELSSSGMKTMAENFRVFCDEKNYPIYFHCIGGADRTGSLAYVLNGILGVDKHDLDVDWETTFYPTLPELEKGYNGPTYWRREQYFDEGFAKYGDENSTWNERIELYLLDCEVTKEEIAKFRSIMLE